MRIMEKPTVFSATAFTASFLRMPVARKLNLPPPLPMMGYAELITTDAVAN